ncbi:MAG: class I SAM-dependent methyltransferase [Pseudomonadota bacterium]
MKNTERFSKTVGHYQSYRPNYPKEMLDFLLTNKILSNDKIIADIGSGTGIFSQQLLRLGLKVFAIEPNKAMREFAEQQLTDDANFVSINGAAEQTTLLDDSVDVISVATAFHWFDRQACRKEFKRILRDEGYVLLFWNLRLPELALVLQDYEQVLRHYCPTYKGIPSQQICETEILNFFAKYSGKIYNFSNQQTFNLEGLIGRLHSTSYSLRPEQPNYDKMIDAITQVFNRHQKNGQLVFPYTTKLYLGKL